MVSDVPKTTVKGNFVLSFFKLSTKGTNISFSLSSPLSGLEDDEKEIFGQSGFPRISTGLTMPRDSMMSVLVFLVAVAVRPSNGTCGRMLPIIASFP